tara:strand:+ start:335 stop:655 length:321 start_codon:yes stop_codon:yes gene_type:complete
MKKFKNRTTLPLDQYTGTVFKIEMMLSRSRMHPNERKIINIGTHLMTNEVADEITICQFNGKTITYGMGHTYSSPASLKEISDWLALELGTMTSRSDMEHTPMGDK